MEETDIFRVLHFVLIIYGLLNKIPFFLYSRDTNIFTICPCQVIHLPSTSFSPILQSGFFPVPDYPFTLLATALKHCRHLLLATHSRQTKQIFLSGKISLCYYSLELLLSWAIMLIDSQLISVFLTDLLICTYAWVFLLSPDHKTLHKMNWRWEGGWQCNRSWCWRNLSCPLIELVRTFYTY